MIAIKLTTTNKKYTENPNHAIHEHTCHSHENMPKHTKNLEKNPLAGFIQKSDCGFPDFSRTKVLLFPDFSRHLVHLYVNINITKLASKR